MLYNRLLVIFLACVIVLSACDRDISITEQLVMNAPNAEAEEPSLIPDWLKEKLWRDKETLIAELVALENAGTLGGTKIHGIVIDHRPVTVLANQITMRQLQDYVYAKWINAEGIAIIATGGIEDRELEVARDIVLAMTAKHPKIREYLHYDAGFYMVLYEAGRFLTSRLPENLFSIHGFVPPGVCTHVGKDNQLICFAPSGGWNLAGTIQQLRRRYPDKTCKEAVIEFYSIGATEDELEWLETYLFPNIEENQYWCENWSEPALSWHIFVHEFAHAMDLAAIRKIDPEFESQLIEAYDNAVANELWTTKLGGKTHLSKPGLGYSSNNPLEYWAVNTQYWFFPRSATDFNDGSENRPEISQRTLKALDPKLYALLSKWYPATEFIRPEHNMFL